MLWPSLSTSGGPDERAATREHAATVGCELSTFQRG